jgi:acyl-coenzyme A thioesterase PaaI-like protein
MSERPGMQMDPERHFSRELGFGHELEEGAGHGWAWNVPELCVPGTDYPHIAALLTFADSVTGLLAGVATAPRISVTVDFRVRILQAPSAGEYEIEARILRTGRTITIGETTFLTPGGRPGESTPFAVAVGTFVASPRPVDERQEDFRGRPARRNRPTLSVPFTERVALRMIEPGIGEVYLRSDLTNSTGTIQGGVLGILGEMAAQTLASADTGRTFVVDDLDVRYLRAARVGPARSSARLLQLHGDRATVAVEIHDTGMDDRLVTSVIAECRALEA